MGPPELQRNGNGFSLTSRAVPCRARCRNRPNCRNCPKSSRYSPAALARTSLVLWRLEPPPGRAWGYAPHTRSRSKTCTTRKLLTAISRMPGDHQCYGGTVVGFFPDLSCRPLQCVLLATAQPGGAGSELSELSELSEKFALFPRRLSLVPRSSFGGWNRRREKHGAMRPIPAAGQRPAPRGNCLPQFPVCCGTTNVTVERLWFPLTSRVIPCRARCPNCPNRPKSSR